MKLPALILSLLAVLFSGALAAPKNILFIFHDDMRPELGAYGASHIKSPNLDRLAAEGLLFNRAYCQVPVCGASRASLLTGIYPARKRFVDFDTWVEKETPRAQTLPAIFKQNGYTTLSNGKVFHHLKDSADANWTHIWGSKLGGLDYLLPETGAQKSSRGRGRIYEFPDVPDNAYPDGQVAEQTIADLRRLKKEGKPFFLAMGLIKPHLPFYAPKKYWDLYDRDSLALADNRFKPTNLPGAVKGSAEYQSYHLGDYTVNSDAWHRMMRHGYYATVSYTDKLIGDVLKELDALGMTDDTIIVYWGDHGWHLGEHNFWGKHNLLHTSIQVPLIIKVPGKASGAATQALVESTDIFPTLCELAGLPLPAQLDGTSLVPLLDQPQAQLHHGAYARWHAGDTIVTDRFIYTQFRGNNGQMLFDLENDPRQNNNVAEEPQHAKRILRLRQLLGEKIAKAGALDF